jgi:hypothetical protein
LDLQKSCVLTGGGNFPFRGKGTWLNKKSDSNHFPETGKRKIPLPKHRILRLIQSAYLNLLIKQNTLRLRTQLQRRRCYAPFPKSQGFTADSLYEVRNNAAIYLVNIPLR